MPAELTHGGGTELVLGAGGIKGFGHVGLLKALQEKSIDISTITGVSIGSLIAALLANGYDWQRILKVLLDDRFMAAPRLSLARLIALPLSRGGLINLKPAIASLVRECKLAPQPNLQIVAFSLTSRQPVLFAGSNYDLTTALSASCAVPLLMRPVYHGHIAGGKVQKVEPELLTDGFLHHANPVQFCKGQAIVSKLGFARSLPRHFLAPADLTMHLAELAVSELLEWWSTGPDEKQHIVIPAGMPDVASLTFGVSRSKCLAMVDHGYRTAGAYLDQALLTGRLTRHQVA
jgi:predicted acylesterase/phospholipase RssA